MKEQISTPDFKGQESPTEQISQADGEQSQGEQADLKEALEKANISESKEIAEISEDIKNFKNPEEIQNEIKKLQKEYDEKKQAWQDFSHVSSTDSGMGALASFGSGEISQSKLETKFPGISSTLEMINTAKSKNSVGFKFWKKPELDDFQLQVIKNYLITGNIGRFNNPDAESKAKETLNKFLEDNKSSEANINTVKQAIWGEQDGTYYENTLSSLKKKLNEASKN